MRKTAATATATSDTAIDMRNVVKYFDQKRPVSLFRREHVRVYALNEVSFQLKRGEFCAYAGPNGAGKSTTFKLLSGMLKPQAGEVSALGMEPSAHRIPLMRRTGVLFGNRSELWWDHPVRASFEWKRVVWDIPDKMYRETLDMLKELLGLHEFWNSFARELSLGQRMKANLALMLLHSPELILLDEPTLGLDVLAKRQMIEFLKFINAERGVTILVTSHDMDDLTEMAKRLILIHKGRLAFDGDHQQLMRQTGDRRILRAQVLGKTPVIRGARLISRTGDLCEYEYNAMELTVPALFAALAQAGVVQDAEIARAPIERVIAELYAKWQREGA
ncbi:MAG: ABC transporter ATP-binding protein [Christensenellales bacterium]|jgi:ABC-2 type transport system ATP-binding protein